MDKFRTTAATATLAAAMLMPAAPGLAAPEPRPARGGSDVISASGTCSDGTNWTLAGKSRGLRVLVRLQLRGVPKQRWAAELTQNERTIKRVRAKKMKRNGKLKIQRPAPNLPGPDQFTFRAVNRTTGNDCQGTLAY